MHLQLFFRYCALSILRSRVWHFMVTWRHRSRDHLIPSRLISYWWSFVTNYSISDGFRNIQWRMWRYMVNTWHDLNTTFKQRSRSFMLAPVDFLHAVNSNWCSRTHHLATIHVNNVTLRQTQNNTSIGAIVSILV